MVVLLFVVTPSGDSSVIAVEGLPGNMTVEKAARVSYLVECLKEVLDLVFCYFYLSEWRCYVFDEVSSAVAG